MNCPHCQAPQYRALGRVLVSAPKTAHPVTCTACQAKLQLAPPRVLANDVYAVPLAALLALTLALVLVSDLAVAARISMLSSGLALAVGGVALAAWSNSSLR